MARPILDVTYEVVAGAGQAQDALDDVEVLELVASGDVVDLARRSVPQHQLDGGAVVADVEPVSGLAAVAVHR